VYSTLHTVCIARTPLPLKATHNWRFGPSAHLRLSVRRGAWHKVIRMRLHSQTVSQENFSKLCAVLKLFNLNDMTWLRQLPQRQMATPLPLLMGSGRGAICHMLYASLISRPGPKRFSLGQKNNNCIEVIKVRCLPGQFTVWIFSFYSTFLCISLSKNHKFYWPNCRANYAANKWPIMKLQPKLAKLTKSTFILAIYEYATKTATTKMQKPAATI